MLGAKEPVGKGTIVILAATDSLPKIISTEPPEVLLTNTEKQLKKNYTHLVGVQGTVVSSSCGMATVSYEKNVEPKLINLPIKLLKVVK